MAKPSQFPEWGSAQTNNVDPSGGQKASGWTPTQLAVSSYFNWVLYTIYLWIVYLDSGNWVGPITITGDLTATGNLSIQGNTALGNAIGDTLAVSGPAAVAGNTTGPDFRYTTLQTLTVPASAACEYPGTHNYDHVNMKRVVGTSVGPIAYPLIGARVDDHIKAWRLYVVSAAASGTITAQLFKTTTTAGGAPVVAAVGATSTLVGTSVGCLALGIAMDVTIAAGVQYEVRFTGGGVSGVDLYQAEYDLTRP